MKNDFLVAITQLCNERGLPKETVLAAIEQALVSAYRRNFGGTQNITAQIDPTSGKVKIFSSRTIVDEVHDRRIEVALAEARALDPMAEVGGTLTTETTPDDFGRIAAQTAKQVVLQRIREAERDVLFTQFSAREGEVVMGTVQNIDSQNITVGLGKIEAILPRNEQIPTEKYHHQKKIRAYIVEVNKTARGPQIVLSRTHRNMLRRLFEVEVPEIFNGLVEIKAIAREPGLRSKIAVAATQDGIDPVGACVGKNGGRIQAVVRELNGEKIDVIEWNADMSKFIAKALSPAQIESVTLGEDEHGDKVANVLVKHDVLSLAIGKEGQNARLAAKLTGWRIDIKSELQIAEDAKRKADAEAARLAAMTPEEIAAEEEAKARALQAAQMLAEAEKAIAEPVVEPVELPVIEEPVALEPVVETPIETIEPVAAATPEIAPTVVAADPNQTFEEALADFEADEDESDLSPEELLKRKADKRKRQVLVFDESLGKVVAKRRRKGKRLGVEDWVEEE